MTRTGRWKERGIGEYGRMEGTVGWGRQEDGDNRLGGLRRTGGCKGDRRTERSDDEEYSRMDKLEGEKNSWTERTRGRREHDL